MPHHGEITVRFPIPLKDDAEDLALGYEAIQVGKKMASKIVKALHDIGVTGAEQTHRIFVHEAVHTAPARDVEAVKAAPEPDTPVTDTPKRRHAP